MGKELNELVWEYQMKYGITRKQAITRLRRDCHQLLWDMKPGVEAKIESLNMSLSQKR